MNSYSESYDYIYLPENLDQLFAILVRLAEDPANDYTCFMAKGKGCSESGLKEYTQHKGVSLVHLRQLSPWWLCWAQYTESNHQAILEVEDPSLITPIFHSFISIEGSVSLINRKAKPRILGRIANCKLEYLIGWDSIVSESDRTFVNLDFFIDPPFPPETGCRISSGLDVDEAVVESLIGTAAQRLEEE